MTTITHFSPFSLSMTRLRMVMHLPHDAVQPRPAALPSQLGWLERLAAWSDRHPPRQHRLGSYTGLR